MTYEQVKGIIAEIATALGVDYAYSAFQDSVERNRFLVWYYGDSNDLFADCINYASIEGIVIEFYSRKKEITSEQTIQRILASHEIAYDKATAYISDQRCNMTRYDTEVLISEQ